MIIKEQEIFAKANQGKFLHHLIFIGGGGGQDNCFRPPKSDFSKIRIALKSALCAIGITIIKPMYIAVRKRSPVLLELFNR